MRTTIPAVLTAVFLTTLPSLALAQGRVTQDPNAPGVRAVAAVQESDPRLNQKITYYSGYKRLSDVADDLKRVGGVNIIIGKNRDDWHIKDIPLVVCVKDMPLGDLLKAMADATHTHLGVERTVKDDPERSYRLYRRSVDEAKIDSYFEKRRKSRLAQVKWQWDALAAYGKSAQVKGVPDNTWYLGKVIASLGDQGWARLQDGNKMRVAMTDTSAVAKQGFQQLYGSAWNEVADRLRQEKKLDEGQSAEDSVQSAALEIKLTDKGDLGRTELSFHMVPLSLNVTQTYASGYVSSYTQYHPWSSQASDILQLAGKLTGLPPYPESVVPPSLEDDMGNSDMLYLKHDRDTKWPEMLDKKIALGKPEGKDDIKFAEFIRQLSEASGLNIIAEDFKDQYRPEYRGSDFWFAQDTTVADTLRKLCNGGRAGCEWFFSEKQNLLLGWADDRSVAGWDDRTAYCSTWRHHHRNLVSADYLDGIRQKLSADGLSFDDVIRLSTLSDGSFGDWISNTDLDDLTRIGWGVDNAWWMLYDALTPADKRLAKSDGLPLGKFDTEWIAGFFRTQRRCEDYVLRYGTTDATISESEAQERAVSDPSIISTMVIRLKEEPSDVREVIVRDEKNNVVSGSMQPAPPALKLYTCSLRIDYKIDGKPKTMLVRYEGNTRFPVRSREREAEIIKAAEEADKAAKGK